MPDTRASYWTVKRADVFTPASSSAHIGWYATKVATVNLWLPEEPDSRNLFC
jgi:hypothetical protein